MNIDMSDVVLDPAVSATPFLVRRRRDVVNDFGESELPDPPVWLPASGAVTPLGENALTREDAYQSQSSGISVITQFQLRGAGRDERGNEFQPDIIKYNGTEYTVMVVNNWPGGDGFVAAEAVTAEFVLAYQTRE